MLRFIRPSLVVSTPSFPSVSETYYAKQAYGKGMSGLGATNSLNFKMVGAIAKPLDAYTLGVFQGLQRILNAYASSYNLRKIAEDGDIGPATHTLARQVLGVATVSAGTTAPFGPASILQGKITTVKDLATLAGSVGAALAAMRALPFNTTADPDVRGSTLDTRAGGGTPLPDPATPPPAPSGGFNWGLAAGVAGAGILGFLLLRKKRS